METAEKARGLKPDLRADMNALLETARADFARLAQNFLVEDISLQDFQQEFAQTMLDAHARAASLGRRLAGDMPRFGFFGDRLLAMDVVRAERGYLDGFTIALRDGKLSESEAILRAQSYAGRVLGTANEAFVSASGESLFTWVLGAPETGHCAECPAIAAGSPYTRQTLPTYPRRNETPCLFRCTCYLRREDGVRGFA